MGKEVGFITMEKADNREFNSVGSSRIRARWLLNYWPEAEEYMIGKSYSTLIFQKVYWKAMMEAFEGTKVLDICDADWLEGKPVFEFVDMADATVTSTEALAEYIRKMRPKALVKCIPDRVYLPEAMPVHGRHEGQLRKVAWFGYSHNSHYLAQAFEELAIRGIELVAISNDEINLPLAYRNRLKVTNIPYSYDTVNKEIIKCGAVILPKPSGDEKGKYKSENKVIQSWALRMPVVRTDRDLDKFMDPVEREKEAELRRKEVEEKWDCKISVKEYKELIEKIKKNV
jgi:hypothetical protein